ncbi:hypothetical protein GS597_04430 [Synechococcales cyanobacterium C]|uniref:Uncharacterized protein n=1 Tax=Petrachloros mirabilis ULC683 TaxID=2781853 RepID=A0A8K2A765_9CYAN|nr:hypothetical protein [Petrachloros mirabilis]NCJ05770.1 hypothetical protein [Petrachloros mirabilis ULC683]
MQLQFVPVDDFYFALTLCVRTLEEIEDPALVERVRSHLSQTLGQPSTIAAAAQNTFNYVFQVLDYDNSPAPQLVASVADWQDKLRLSSDYGWMLNADRKPIRTERYPEREQFTQGFKAALADLGLSL